MFKNATPFIKYLYYSFIVTVLDVAIVWVLFHLFQVNLVTANTAGVIGGFVVHYILSSKSIFDTKLGIAGFVIYFGTFMIGLILADGLIYIGKYYFFVNLVPTISFLISKGISIVVPFFFLYYIRKILFQHLKNRSKHEDKKESVYEV